MAPGNKLNTLTKDIPPGTFVFMPFEEARTLIESNERVIARLDALETFIAGQGITLQQVADRCRVDRSTVSRWIHKGRKAEGQVHRLRFNAATGLVYLSDLNKFLSDFFNVK